MRMLRDRVTRVNITAILESKPVCRTIRPINVFKYVSDTHPDTCKINEIQKVYIVLHTWQLNPTTQSYQTLPTTYYLCTQGWYLAPLELTVSKRSDTQVGTVNTHVCHQGSSI